MDDARPGYRRRGDTFLIELRLRDPRQLFNSLDPAPFHEKDLDEDAERYIVEAAEEFALATPLQLVIHLPEVAPDMPETLAAAIHHYFAYRARVTARELHRLLRRGRLSLLIGLAFLFFCIGGRELVLTAWGATWAAEILAEGLLISGWVAMWQPLQIFLYGWWPIRRRQRVFDKLASLNVEVTASAAPPGDYWPE